jgi:hypothetical protein
MIAFPLIDDPSKVRALNQTLAEQLGKALVPISWGTDPDANENWRMYQGFFPPWTALQQPERCARVLPELHLMAQDGYWHQLPVLHTYVLQELLSDLVAALDDDLAAAEQEGSAAHRAALEAERSEVETLRIACTDFSACDTEIVVTGMLQGGAPPAAAVRQLLATHRDMLPTDIRERLETLT